MAQWECIVCGLIYDEKEGWPDDGIAPGTKWADVPDDWTELLAQLLDVLVTKAAHLGVGQNLAAGIDVRVSFTVGHIATFDDVDGRPLVQAVLARPGNQVIILSGIY